MELIYKSKKVVHLAGIVPVCGQPLDYKFPWPDCMIPIANNYLAIEKSVFECASAGCESIWVVANKGIEPILRKRLGDYVTDPASVSSFKIYGQRRDINIYYVPISLNDRHKRDSLGWSILYGADTAFRVSAYLSKWMIPEKYYCSIPYGITDDKFIRSKRSDISDIKKTIFTFENKTIKDDLPISFTFDAEDYKRCRDLIKKRKFDDWYVAGESADSNKKTNESKFYSLKEIFSGLDINNSHKIELPWFYDIMTWEGYRKFIASEHASSLAKNNFLFPTTKRKIFIREAFGEKSRINREYEMNSERVYYDEQAETETNS